MKLSDDNKRLCRYNTRTVYLLSYSYEFKFRVDLDGFLYPSRSCCLKSEVLVPTRKISWMEDPCTLVNDRLDANGVGANSCELVLRADLDMTIFMEGFSSLGVGGLKEGYSISLDRLMEDPDEETVASDFIFTSFGLDTPPDMEPRLGCTVSSSKLFNAPETLCRR